MKIMHVLLVYDIEEDKRRTKIADACLDYGLDRIQYSAFRGVLSRNHQEELMLKIDDLLDETPGKIHLYVMDEPSWNARIIIDPSPDMEIQHGQPTAAD
jgi:CRISPR-associated protein Cas2